MALIVGDDYQLNNGHTVKAVALNNGIIAVPFRVKCLKTGCKHYKHGYLTEGAGGGAFYNKKGDFLADLRDKLFACTEHQR